MKIRTFIISIIVLSAALFVADHIFVLRAKRIPLIIITIDTLREDRLGCYGYDKDTSPNIDAFSKDALLFEDHHVPAPITLPSHVSLFTGLNPYNHGIRSNSNYRLNGNAVTLSEILHDRLNYRTGAVISAGVLHSTYGLDQGFDDYWWDKQQKKSDSDTPADEATSRAISWLDRRTDDPFFLWVHYFDPHAPYTAPERFSFESPYDNEVAYVDEQLGIFFAYLKEKGLYDEALIILTSDHGQLLGEHGVRGHVEYLYEQTLHVPLLVKFPQNVKAGNRIAGMTRAIDIMPTVLSYLKIPYYRYVDGISLLNRINGTEQLTELELYAETFFGVVGELYKKAIISKGYKFVTNHNMDKESYLSDIKVHDGAEKRFEKILKGSRKTRKLFDLNADPEELNNIYHLSNDLSDEMERKINRFRKRPGIPEMCERFSIKAELLEQLKALGYN